MTRIIEAVGAYDEKENMYIATYRCGVTVSTVKGKTQNTLHLKSDIGTIRAIEHAMAANSSSNYLIYHNSELLRDVLADRKRPNYPEVAKAYKLLKPYSRYIKYKGGLE